MTGMATLGYASQFCLEGLVSEDRLKIIVVLVQWAAFIIGPLSVEDLERATTVARWLVKACKGLPGCKDGPNIHGILELALLTLPATRNGSFSKTDLFEKQHRPSKNKARGSRCGRGGLVDKVRHRYTGCEGLLFAVALVVLSGGMSFNTACPLLWSTYAIIALGKLTKGSLSFNEFVLSCLIYRMPTSSCVVPGLSLPCASEGQLLAHQMYCKRACRNCFENSSSTTACARAMRQRSRLPLLMASRTCKVGGGCFLGANRLPSSLKTNENT
jgi:hypothetical protein